MKNVTVKEVYTSLTKEPPLIGSDALLKDAIRVLLKDPLSRSIYVVNDDGKLAGIVSTLMLLKVSHYMQGKKTVMKDDIFNAVRIAKAETIKTQRFLMYLRCFPVKISRNCLLLIKING